MAQRDHQYRGRATYIRKQVKHRIIIPNDEDLAEVHLDRDVHDSMLDVRLRRIDDVQLEEMIRF